MNFRWWLVGVSVLGIGLSGATAQAQSILTPTSSSAQTEETLGGDGQRPVGDHRPILSGTLSLAEATRIAREQNLGVQVATQDVSIAEAQIKSAQSARLPVVSLGAAATLANEDFFYTTGVGPGNIPRKAAGEFNAGLSLPLYTGGRLKARVNQTQVEQEVALADRATAQLEAILIVKQAYLQALFTRSQLDTYRKYVAEREVALQNTRDRFAVGKVARVYVLVDQTELANAKRALIAAQTVFDKAMVDLKTGLGVSLASEFTLSDTLEAQPIASDLSQILAQARQNSPELSALRLKVKASEADIQIAKAAFLPQVNLYTQAELRAPGSPGFGSGGSIAVVANWPVFDFGGRKAEVDKSTASIRKAQLQVQQKEQELAKSLTQAWLDLQEAKSSMTLTQTNVAQAEEEQRLAQERFAVGRSIQVEVLRSSVALLRARLDHFKTFYEYNLAIAQLERLTGIEIQS
ncbi:MAG: TolC family protein [Acaryochloridaceae cyanobacterium CSU_3_4]|nr:TolC family protein [Acaryochloridaceae cyanobacterium CSU_3_4]